MCIKSFVLKTGAMKHNRHWLTFLSMLLWAAAACGCTGHFFQPVRGPAVTHGDGFVIVTVTTQDSLPDLAQTYLGSRDKAWWIAAYHQIDRVSPGQRLVIPQQPIVYGGLRADGYQTVPVLRYPRIDPDGTDPGVMAADTFQSQMQYLRENGYVTVSLDQLHAFINLEDHLPPNAVVITIDSAERWVHEVAYPILKRHGHAAALFVPAELVGAGRNMGWHELAEMAADGFDIGTTGLAVRDLTRMPSDTSTDIYLKVLEDEIRLSRQVLEDHLNKPCLYFAYPGGETNDLIVGLLKQYGYRTAFTRQPGDNPFFVNNFMIHRRSVDPREELDQFREKLTTFIPAKLQ